MPVWRRGHHRAKSLDPQISTWGGRRPFQLSSSLRAHRSESEAKTSLSLRPPPPPRFQIQKPVQPGGLTRRKMTSPGSTPTSTILPEAFAIIAPKALSTEEDTRRGRLPR